MGIKGFYDGYLHENGTVQVKRMPFHESLIDTTSPFVKKYLGEVEAESWEEAREKLEERLKA